MCEQAARGYGRPLLAPSGRSQNVGFGMEGRPRGPLSGMSVVGGRSEDICSYRVFLSLTPCRHRKRGAARYPKVFLDVDLSQYSSCELADGQWTISGRRQPRVRPNSEVSNGGRDNLPSHFRRCVHRHRGLGVRPQAESALCNIVAQDRRQTRAFKGCSI
jgi:hypothetical protein